MTLYDIAQTYVDFMEAVEADEIPEEAIEDTLESIQEEFNQKADNLACLVKNLKAEAEAIKSEELVLKARREGKARKAEALKNYLFQTMQQLGKNKLETARNLLSFRKSASLQIDDEKDFYQRHSELCKIETVVTIPKADITNLIKNGEEISGAQLVSKLNLQIK